MKKQLLAAAALALVSGVAAAQSATVYGIIDTGVYTTNNGNNGKSQTSMVSGTWLPSLFGITGSEDLGGGLKASFKLEGDLNTTSGAAGNGQAYGVGSTSLFDRYAIVSLSSNTLGTVDLGRQIDNLFLQSFLNGVVPTHTNSLAVNGLLFGGSINANGDVSGAFVSNAIGYTSPTVNGFNLKGQYVFGGAAGKGSQGSGYNALVSYTGVAGLTLNAGYEQLKDVDVNAGSTAFGAPSVGTGATLTKKLLGAKYAVNQQIDLAAQWNQYGYTGYTVDGYEIGAAYHVSPVATVAVNYETFHATGTDDATIVSLKGKYSLSKRTALWGLVSSYNSQAAETMFQGYGANVPNLVSEREGMPAHKTATGFGVGVTHQF